MVTCALWDIESLELDRRPLGAFGHWSFSNPYLGCCVSYPDLFADLCIVNEISICENCVEMFGCSVLWLLWGRSFITCIKVPIFWNLSTLTKRKYGSVTVRYLRFLAITIMGQLVMLRAVESQSGPQVIILVRGPSDMFSSNGVIVKWINYTLWIIFLFDTRHCAVEHSY